MEPLTREESTFVAKMDSALHKLPVYRGTVYRNICFDLQGEAALEAFALEHVLDMPIVYQAFTSASKAMDGYTVDGELAVHIDIESLSARDISQIGITSEEEVLFPRDTVFLVTQARREGKKLYLHLKEIVYERSGTEPRGSEGVYHWDTGGEQAGDPSERGTTVRDMQTYDTQDTQLPSVPQWDSQGDSVRAGRPHAGVPRGPGTQIRSEGPWQIDVAPLYSVKRGQREEVRRTAGAGSLGANLTAYDQDLSEAVWLIEEGWRETEENGKAEESEEGMVEQLRRELDRAREEKRKARRGGRPSDGKISEKDKGHIEEGWRD